MKINLYRIFFSISSFISVDQTCKRFKIESKLKKFKNFPPNSVPSYANTLKNIVTKLDIDQNGVKHEQNGKFQVNSGENFELIYVFCKDIHQALSVSSSLNEIDALDPMDELKGQKTLLNSLHISRIPIDSIKTEDAQILVLQKLCKKANASYNKDVDQFYVKNNALIVKFHRLEAKEKIRNYAENKDIWTNELLELSKGQDPGRIKVCHYMTPFYSKMWFAAEKFKNQGRLHLIKLSEKGLVVKRKSTSDEMTFLSEPDLVRFIRNEK